MSPGAVQAGLTFLAPITRLPKSQRGISVAEPWVSPPAELQLAAGESIHQPGAGGGFWVLSSVAEKRWHFGVAILYLRNGATPPPAAAPEGRTCCPPALEEAVLKACFAAELDFFVAESL